MGSSSVGQQNESPFCKIQLILQRVLC